MKIANKFLLILVFISIVSCYQIDSREKKPVSAYTPKTTYFRLKFATTSDSVVFKMSESVWIKDKNFGSIDNLDLAIKYGITKNLSEVPVIVYVIEMLKDSEEYVPCWKIYQEYDSPKIVSISTIKSLPYSKSDDFVRLMAFEDADSTWQALYYLRRNGNWSLYSKDQYRIMNNYREFCFDTVNKDVHGTMSYLHAADNEINFRGASWFPDYSYWNCQTIDAEQQNAFLKNRSVIK